jgi:metal-responsive CopG/Arc/MetJ family transcriptional regulator
MTTKKEILNFAVDEVLMKRLDDYRFENRINTRSEALRRLLDEALKRYEKEKTKK